MLDKLTLQICPLLCMSLVEVQGDHLIFMEIRDNIHQLSFTSFIFIRLLILTLSTRRPLSARFGWVFWTNARLRSLLWELKQTLSELCLTLSIWFSQGSSHFVEEFGQLSLAPPAACTQKLQHTWGWFMYRKPFVSVDSLSFWVIIIHGKVSRNGNSYVVSS